MQNGAVQNSAKLCETMKKDAKTEQKKAKMKSKIKSDELEDIKSHFPYLYKEIEHAKKTLQWRIRFQCD